MRKTGTFIKFLKNINYSINNLLEKNLNKLKFNNLINLGRSNKIILTFVALFILLISYLLAPTFFNQTKILSQINSQLLEKYNLSFKFSKNLNYNFFPRPHFISKEVLIFDNKNKISEIKKIKIFISFKNLISIKKIKINKVVIENANFNLNKENYNFFVKLLDKNFIGNNLIIKQSNIFFKNFNNEVLFINKILEMSYAYDTHDLKNVLKSKNELFNIPYDLILFDDTSEKKLFSKIKINLLKFQLENEFNYLNKKKFGSAEITFNKLKSLITYDFYKDYFEFKLLEELDDPQFSYEGKININPFYSVIEGKSDKLNLYNLINSNSIIIQLLKTEILNNSNIDFKININADSIYRHSDFKKIFLVSKIQDGLIDIDETTFKWKTFADFKFIDTLIYVKDGELVLDGKLEIDVNNYNEIYKFLLTPKNYRKELKNLSISFSYNFNQKTANLNNIIINAEQNQNLNEIMSNIILKENNLQNKIYLKKLFNDALKSYAG